MPKTTDKMSNNECALLAIEQFILFIEWVRHMPKILRLWLRIYIHTAPDVFYTAYFVFNNPSHPLTEKLKTDYQAVFSRPFNAGHYWTRIPHERTDSHST